jgi:hypothetical protein
LEHFLEKFPFASARIITVHFNGSHFIVKDILLRELGLQKFSRRWVPCRLSDAQKKCCVGTSVGLFALLDQNSELQFEGIATGNKSCICCLIESDSMLVHRRENVIPRLRPGISIKKL